MSQFAVILSDQQSTPVTRGDIGSRVTGLRLSTVLPGGCGELRCDLPAAASGLLSLPRELLPQPYNFRVAVLDGGELFWAGRLDALSFAHGAQGPRWEIIARGYGVNLSDQIYTPASPENVQNVATGTVVSNAITDLCPQIDATSITATGYTLTNSAAINLAGMSAGAVIAWAAEYGDSSSNPQIWYVYPDADAGKYARFTFAPRPTTAGVEGYLRDFEAASFGFEGRQLANRVVVIYNSGANSVTREDTALQGVAPAGWSVIRTKVVHLPEITDFADANQAGDAILTAAKTLRMSATSVTLKKGAVLRDANRAKIDPWRVRSGQLFHIRDVLPVNAQLGSLVFSNSFLIVGTSWDEDSQTLTLTPESYESALESAVAQVRQVIAGRHTT